MCVYRRMGIVLLISGMVLVLGSCGDKKTDMREVADRVEKSVAGKDGFAGQICIQHIG